MSKRFCSVVYKTCEYCQKTFCDKKPCLHRFCSKACSNRFNSKLVSHEEMARRAKLSSGKFIKSDLRFHLPNFKGHLGHRHFPEARLKMSLAKLGKHLSEEHKKKISLSNIGKKHTSEAKEKIRQSRLGKSLPEWWKTKLSESHKGLKLSEAKKQKISQSMMGKRHAKESYDKMMETKRLNGYVPPQISSIEKILWNILDRNNIQYQKNVQFGRYNVDIFLPEYKLVLECDGDYWHSLTNVKERDKKKELMLKNDGYQIIRLTEYEIRKHPVITLQNALRPLNIVIQ